MNLIAYKSSTGTLCIMTPVLQAEETEAQALQRCLGLVPNDATDTTILASDSIPSNRSFRDAWDFEMDGAISVDMPKAREIHLQRIREARNAKLEALDVETLKAIGAGDDTRRQEVEGIKQQLRDIPEEINLDQYQTPDELQAFWPELLSTGG